MLNERDTSSRFQPLPLVEQAHLAEKHGLETLLFCPNVWALRHVFINQETGETVRALQSLGLPLLWAAQG